MIELHPPLSEVSGPSALFAELDELRKKGEPPDAWKEAARRAIDYRALATDGRALLETHRTVEAAAALLDKGDVDGALATIGGCETHLDLTFLGDSMLANLVAGDNPFAAEAAHRLLKVVWIAMHPQFDFVSRFWRNGAISNPLEVAQA